MTFDPLYYALIALTAMLAGAINAVAGGGSFFTFPALIWLGIPPITANATNKVGLWLGAVGSIKGYLQEIRDARSFLPLALTLNILGGGAGTFLLLSLEGEQFRATIPWLMLLATLSFAFGNRIRQWTHRTREHNSPLQTVIGHILQFIIAVYAGFFGAGIGIFMLALYQWMGMKDIHVMNGIKVSAAAAAHTISSLIVIAAGAVIWDIAVIMLIGAFIGGYYSAILAKKIPSHWLKRAITAYAACITLYFFVQSVQ